MNGSVAAEVPIIPGIAVPVAMTDGRIASETIPEYADPDAVISGVDELEEP